MVEMPRVVVKLSQVRKKGAGFHGDTEASTERLCLLQRLTL
jgi:hypothetical protein